MPIEERKIKDVKQKMLIIIFLILNINKKTKEQYWDMIYQHKKTNKKIIFKENKCHIQYLI